MNARQRESLERTRRALGLVIEDRNAFLTGFLQRLGIADSESACRDAARFVPDVQVWLDAQIINGDDLGSVLLPVAVLIGEILIQQHGGAWFLEENPTSPDFGNYVVGRFTRDGYANRSLNPFRAARHHIDKLRGCGAAGGSTSEVRSVTAADTRSTRSLMDVITDLSAEASTPLKLEIDYAGPKAESAPRKKCGDLPPWIIWTVLIAVGLASAAVILHKIRQIWLVFQDMP